MNSRLLLTLLTIVALLVGASADAQRVGGAADRPGFRNQRGVNPGQPPAVYAVVSVDGHAQTVRLRAADGSTADVYVPNGVYDPATLGNDDKVQVNLLEADGIDSTLSAASIWPVK